MEARIYAVVSLRKKRNRLPWQEFEFYSSVTYLAESVFSVIYSSTTSLVQLLRDFCCSHTGSEFFKQVL